MSNNRRRRRKSKAESIFRLKPLIKAAPMVWDHVKEDAASEEEAIGRLLELINKYGRRPTQKEVAEFMVQAPTMSLVEMLAAVVAIHRWYRTTPMARAGVMVGLVAAQDADYDPGRTVTLRLHVFRFVHAILQDLHGPELTELQDARRMFRGLLATSLAPDDDPARAAEGRALLAEHIADYRRAVDAAEKTCSPDRRKLRGELAQALANMGQALTDWAERHDCDDPKSRLEEALVLHNEAMTFPERVADPENPVWRFHSLRMRGTTQRQLARYEDNEERILALLDGAVNDARAAREVVTRYPGRCPDGAWIELNLVNAMANRLRKKLRLEMVAADEAIREFEEIERLAKKVRPSIERRAAPLVQQMWGGIERLRNQIEQTPRKVEAADVTRSIAAALTTLQESRATSIDPAAVRGVAQELEALSEDVVLPGPTMQMLGGMLGYIDIEVVGPSMARRLMIQESRLLEAETGEARDGWDPVQYVEDGFRGYMLRLCNPTWSHAERRIAAGWTSVLASARLTWAQGGTRPVDILGELRLADLRGSTAWRSDIHFYGQGPVREGPVPTEESWRCYLYRTRWERDHVVDYLHSRELLALMASVSEVPVPEMPPLEFAHGGQIFPHGTPREEILQSTGIAEERWQTTADGIVVPREMTPEKARVESTKLLEELRRVWAMGFSSGWAPKEVPSLPEPDANDLRRWLASNRDTAVLCVGAGLTPTLTWAAGDAIQVERIDSDDKKATEALHAYLHARENHTYGIHDGEAFDPTLPIEELEARYTAKVATPEATAELNRALDSVSRAFGATFGPALSRARSSGVGRIVLLARAWARHVPWHLIPVDGHSLGEVFAVATVETLAPIPRSQPRDPCSALYIGGVAGPSSSLQLGKAVLSPLSDRVEGPSCRDDFEEMASSARVLRVYAHGSTIILNSDASGIELDEDDLRAINRFSVSEVRMLDLKGARRVELWACESGRGDVIYSTLLQHDEPTGVDAAVLLAGAELAISSLWIQYTLSTAMIAEAFLLELRARWQPEAKALGAAVGRYRAAVAPGGTFSQAVEDAIAGAGGESDVESSLREGLKAWRRELWMEMLGLAAPPMTKGGQLAGTRLGPIRKESSPPKTAEQLLAPFRAPIAWAGWKVTLRSKECFDPNPESAKERSTG